LPDVCSSLLKNQTGNIKKLLFCVWEVALRATFQTQNNTFKTLPKAQCWKI
jgi:hypothetical protein